MNLRSQITRLTIPLFLMLMAIACRELEPEHGPGSVDWKARSVSRSSIDSLVAGQTYLSIYTKIYSSKEKRTLNLTATVSVRNTNNEDSVYIEKVEYYDTSGTLIRTKIDSPVFIAPMETIEIVVSEDNLAGGTGANFLFYWRKKERTPEPFFEGVMISTSGQQGISFTTQGRRVK